MTKLLRVTRDTTAGHSLLYLYYANDEHSARTIEITENLAIDEADDGRVIGVELIDPDTEDLEALTRVARERDLSLEGIFSFV